MAELKIAINTQQAKLDAEGFKSILNDIKTMARELDGMSLNKLGGTLGRLTAEAEKLQSAMRGVAGSLTAGLNVDTSKLAAVPAQLNAITTSAQATATAAKSVAEAFAQGVRLTPAQFSGEMARQAQAEAAAKQQEIEATVARERQAQQQMAAQRQAMVQQRMEQAQTVAAFEEAKRQEEVQAHQQSVLRRLNSERAYVQQLLELRQASQQRLLPQYTETSLQRPVMDQYTDPSLRRPTIAMPQFTQSTQPLSDVEEGLRQALDRARAQRAAATPTRTRSEVAQATYEGSRGLTAEEAEMTFSTSMGRLKLPPGVRVISDSGAPGAGGGAGVAATQETASKTKALGEAFTETKVKKDALDKNLGTMSGQGGSLWKTSFALSILASALGILSFRSLIQEAQQLAETLVNTGMQLERATSLFGLMKEGTMTSAEGVALATSTAKEFGLAVLPAIEGLGRMQASAYGTASAGEVVNNAFRGMMSGLGAISADAPHVVLAMNALSESIGRSEISSRNLRQLSREFPGLKERVAEAFGTKDVDAFMVVLDKGNITMSQWLNALAKGLSGSITEQALKNINTLSGAVAGFHNAMLGLIQVMLNAGFKQDFIEGLKDLTATLTSPAVINAAQQFAVMFGTVIMDALKLFSYAAELAANHMNLFLGALGAIVTGGILLSAVAGIVLLNLAFAGSAAIITAALGPIAAVAVALGIGVGIWAAYADSTNKAQKAIEEQKKATEALALTEKGRGTNTEVEHQKRYAEDQERIRQHMEQLIGTTVMYRTELDLLDQGIRKDSIAFTGLADAYKYINDQAAKGNDIDAEKVKRIIELGLATASYAAQVAKRADNEKMLRDLREDSTVTQSLIGLASGGANASAVAMEQQFQDQFKRMKDRFDELVYAETNTARRSSLVDEFKRQAEELRKVSIEAQLYANRLKAIQDIQQGFQSSQLEEEVLNIWKSVNAEAGTATQEVTRATPSAVASFRPATVQPVSDAVNATLHQLDRANIGAQRQQINGNVSMTISGNITIANVPGGVTLQGGQAGSQSAINAAGQYQGIIEETAGRYKQDPLLVKAIIAVESAADANAKSAKGAMGLMQLMPGTAAEMRVRDPYDPQQNIEGGVGYFARMRQARGGSIPEGLAAYNAGLGAVQAAGGIPKIGETEKYVRDVIATFLKLGGQMIGAGWQTVKPGVAEAATIVQPLTGVGKLPEARETSAQGFQLGDPQLWAYLTGWMKTILTEAKREDRTGFAQGTGLGELGSRWFGFAPATPPRPFEELEKTTALPGYPPGTQMPLEEGRKIEAEQLKAEAARMHANEESAKKYREASQQQERYRLDVQEKALAARARVEPGDFGEVLATRNARTRLEAARDDAGIRAVGQFNLGVQLPKGFDPNSPEALEVEKQRREVEFTARRGVDRRAIQDQVQYNLSLGEQNRELETSAKYFAEDAKFRDIDAKAANLQRKAIEEAVSPEILAKTQALIERQRQLERASLVRNQIAYNESLTEQNNVLQNSIQYLGQDARYRDIDAEAANNLRIAIKDSVNDEELDKTRQLIAEHARLAKSYQDLNGPLKQYKDSLRGIQDLDVGLQQVSVDALQNLGENYLNVSAVHTRLSDEFGRRTSAAQREAAERENERYANAIRQANRSPTGIGEAQGRILKEQHEQLLAVAKDTQASFSAFDQIGFMFKSFADSIIDSLQRMVIQMLIMKPLAAELESMFSGQPVTGGFKDVFGALLGTGAGVASADEAASAVAGMALKSVGAISLVAGGGNVTLRGVEHFQGGGSVQSGTDTIPAMLTPGEMILNKSQQRNLADSMGGGNVYNFSPTIHAQDGESVRKTLPQMQAEFYRYTERVARRNNVRGV